MDDLKGKVFSKKWMAGAITTVLVVIVGAVVAIGILLPMLRKKAPKVFKG